MMATEEWLMDTVPPRRHAPPGCVSWWRQTCWPCMVWCGGLVVVVALVIGCFFVVEAAAYYEGNTRIDVEETHTRSIRSPAIGNDTGNTFYFIQVTDAHINAAAESRRAEFFDRFVGDITTWICPSFVIVTGDIADSRPAWFQSGQRQADWRIYADTLSLHAAANESFWIDVRGNHDAYGIVSMGGEEAYYGKFSVHKKRGNFLLLHQESFGSYAFVHFDAVPFPGPAYPLTFFGVARSQRLDHLATLLQETSTANHTIVFGHFPLSMISSEQPGSPSRRRLRHLLQDWPVVAYLCGHLHRKELRTREGSLLHLQLADFKLHKMFRIGAMDHDVFSFVDVELGETPIILITNPVDSRFLTKRLPLENIRRSTYVRMFILSAHPIDHVSVVVDEEVLDDAVQVDESTPLFVTAWNPDRWSSGMHTIQVTAEDVKGSINTIQRTFSLDGSVSHTPFFQQTTLKRDAELTVILGFSLLFAYITLILVLLPFLFDEWKRKRYPLWKEEVIQRLEEEDESLVAVTPSPGSIQAERVPSCKKEWWQRHGMSLYTHVRAWWMEIMWQYSSIPSLIRIYLAVVAVVLLVLPLFIGIFGCRDGEWGAAFLWGVSVKGTDRTRFFRPVDTIVMAFVYVLLQYLPLLLFFGTIPYELHRKQRYMAGKTYCRHRTLCGPLAVTCLVIFGVFFLFILVLFGRAYGAYASFFSPGAAWLGYAALVLVGFSYWKYRARPETPTSEKIL